MKTTRPPVNFPKPDQRDDNLDQEEQDILTAYEDGNTVSLLARHREYAKTTSRK